MPEAQRQPLRARTENSYTATLKGKTNPPLCLFPPRMFLPVFGLHNFYFQGCHLLGFIPSHEDTNLQFSLFFSLSSHACNMTGISTPAPPHSAAQLNKTEQK